MTVFLSNRTLHQQHKKRDRERQHGEQPKVVEIGERRSLLLMQIRELLLGELLRCRRIDGLLVEDRLSLEWRPRCVCNTRR
jgi:hypothetical protein